MLSDNQIIEGIAAHDHNALNYVYREEFPKIENLVSNNGGTSEEARDVFQEAMIIVYKKVSGEKLTLSSKFSTYLYAICKLIWFGYRKKHLKRLEKHSEILAVEELKMDYAEEFLDENKELFYYHFERLDPECKKLLKLYFNGLSIEEIRKTLGFKSAHQTSDKKYRCKLALIESIRKDPRFKEKQCIS